MPRHVRVMLAGVPVHIIQRGHNRDAIFFDAADYALYLQHLETLAAEFGCAVHAYCLMSNHVHLLLTPASAAACGRLMKHLSQRHAQYVNRTQRRSGGLWEGRFRSCLTDSERYLLACHAYIEQYPVRAGMVRRARDYPWSSYRANPFSRVLEERSTDPRSLAARGLFLRATLQPQRFRAARQSDLVGHPRDLVFFPGEAPRTGAKLRPSARAR
jgi:REP-associated tyrosine transposase